MQVCALLVVLLQALHTLYVPCGHAVKGTMCPVTCIAVLDTIVLRLNLHVPR